ncbi:MAG: hypothetical protein ABJE95_19310 [Byssovorax sp.]
MAVAGPAVMEAGLPDLVESATDNHETKMTYDPSSRLPILVILVWVCAFTGLGIYGASFYFPDLAAWRAPAP